MINIVGRKKIWFTISSAIIIVTILVALIFSVELDIQFRGGSIVTYSHSGELDKGDFAKTIESVLGGEKVSIQEQRDVTTGEMNLVVTLSSKQGISPEKYGEINDALWAAYPQNNIEVVSTSNVDASIGHDFLIKSVVAVAAASVLMIVYIAFRFRKIGGWSAGVFSVLALLHDVMFVFAVFVFFRIPLNDSFIAVVLTILGYSINATVVIYDRIRENKRLLGTKVSLAELVNTSINQSLTRSINTTISTVIAMGTVCVVAIVYNVSSIITFAAPMLVGMIAGAYSSVCIAGPLWVTWQEHKLAKKHG
ncbi:protein translocase subunit SecF [Youxingia wuxianensis]|uniref:Protein-export membrane protein SecF n=1 Tax=Youxingia wuxianensis TaxID=2763678 RepID=A0A926EN17_9FIRM|nr:protein translocase subunit SecF [Youxingia wuxianensis]MBC8584676.1 protein translocase subunit SecF [Youxingia wuxianensis]